MSMSKRDFQAIARVIYNARSAGPETDPFREIVSGLSSVLAVGNPRFDRARFVEACETGRCKGMSR